MLQQVSGWQSAAGNLARAERESFTVEGPPKQLVVGCRHVSARYISAGGTCELKSWVWHTIPWKCARMGIGFKKELYYA